MTETANPNDLPKAYDPSAIEQKWANYWVSERLFEVSGTPAPGQGRFVQLLPPPNVTGRLHMGHMLNQTEMDILARWHRMRGEVSLWLPGTDHAGIATQMMVERQLASEGTTRQALGREAFIDRTWKWKQQYGGAITDQMRRLGASVDWQRKYFTMDDRLSRAVIESFVRLHEAGLIYRGEYIVNWDPELQTAVSDLEVNHEERAGKLYHVRYPLADGSGSIVIATTRPETMLGDVAVAVNPSDERYKKMVGKKLTLPLVGRDIPVVADDWANPGFGTGAVKVTPAHDPNDFAIGQRHSLPSINVMDETAHINEQGGAYKGLDRFQARTRIVADLEALGLLVDIKDHVHAIAISQRSGTVIEPRLSKQWFIAVNKTPNHGGSSIADAAIDAVKDGHIKFTPEMYSKTYFEWMNNIHDWCISRQLWWGHRIPAWHCAACGQSTVARTAPAACAHCNSADITQETDVLDTWFSSGLLPFTTLGWPEQTPDLAAYYPTDLLVTGFDILFFWVARMIMLGCHFMLQMPMSDGSKRSLAESVPFRDVYIHALVRDSDRQKMSKTKGNVIDPIDIIQRFGTDAVRFTLASMASPGTDIAFSEARTEGNRAFANKIWNAARFILMNVQRAKEARYKIKLDLATISPELPDATPLETRWIFSRLHAVCAEVDRALTTYRFDEAAQSVYRFFWNEFCDWYLEIIKLRLDFNADAPAESRELTAISLAGLTGVFEAALRLLSPFMPFLTEEIWHVLYEGNAPAKSIALTRYPQAADFYSNEKTLAAMDTIQELITAVRALRKDMAVPEKEAAPIRIHGNSRIAALAEAHSDMLSKLARVSAVEISDAPLTGETARSSATFDVAVVYERQIDVPAERDRLEKDIAKYEKGLAAAQKQLGNEAFMAKAPVHIVDGLRKQQSETKTIYDKAKAALAALPKA